MNAVKAIHTHTHTHTYIYIYISDLYAYPHHGRSPLESSEAIYVSNNSDVP